MKVVEYLSGIILDERPTGYLASFTRIYNNGNDHLGPEFTVVVDPHRIRHDIVDTAVGAPLEWTYYRTDAGETLDYIATPHWHTHPEAQ